MSASQSAPSEKPRTPSVFGAQRIDEGCRRRADELLLLTHAAALVEGHDHRHGRDDLLERGDLLLDTVLDDDQIVRVDLDGAPVGVARHELERRADWGGSAAK